MGGTPSASSSGYPVYEQFPNLTPGQQALLGDLNKILLDNMGKGIDPYKGKLSADASPLQNWAFEAIMGLGSGASSRERQAAISKLVSGEPAYDASPEEYERIYRESAEAPELRRYHEELIPYIRHAYGSEGLSGEFIEQLGGASVDLATNLASERAKYRFQGLTREEDALSQARDRSIYGIGLSAEEETRPIRYALTGGAQQRQIEQDAYNAKYMRWAMSQPWANPWLSSFSNVMGTPAFTGATVYGQQNLSGTSGALQGAGSILMPGSGMLWG